MCLCLRAAVQYMLLFLDRFQIYGVHALVLATIPLLLWGIWSSSTFSISPWCLSSCLAPHSNVCTAGWYVDTAGENGFREIAWWRRGEEKKRLESGRKVKKERIKEGRERRKKKRNRWKKRNRRWRRGCKRKREEGDRHGQKRRREIQYQVESPSNSFITSTVGVVQVFASPVAKHTWHTWHHANVLLASQFKSS